MRKTRRKIKRKKRKSKKSIPRNRIIRWYKRLNRPITNRFTRSTTWILVWTDGIFMLICAIWAFVEITARIFGWWGGY